MGAIRPAAKRASGVLRQLRAAAPSYTHPHSFILPAASALVLFSALSIPVTRAWAQAAPQSPKAPSPQLPTLTTADQAHRLTTEEATRGYPVHIRGIVTCIDPSTGPGHAAMFVHDQSGTVYVMVGDAFKAAFAAGTLVDVHGVTDPGSFAPIVEHTHVQAIGKAPLPANPPVEILPRLETGTADGKWVEVEGIVHSVVQHSRGPETNLDYVTLQLEMADGMIGVSMLKEPGADYDKLVDAKVRIQGNAAPMFNRNDQLMGARLMAPGLSAVKIEEPAPSDPYAQPTTRIGDLLRWDQLSTERHRVHLRGTVTMVWPGSSFCIRDASRGICAQTVQDTHLVVGQVADVVGFVGAENGTPELSDAVYRSAGNSSPVVARPVTAEQALLGTVLIKQTSRTDYESELIQVQGRLINIDLTSPETTLLLASNNVTFTAILPKNLAGAEAKSWKVGSTVQVTGICSVRLDARSSVAGAGVASAKSFRVIMRSPGDVVVLVQPSWWTPGHAVLVLSLALTGTLIVLAWAVVLRSRVERQAVLLRESEERFRHLAQHDTLTGLATRLVLQDRLDAALEHARRYQTGLALLMLDVDKFKQINDTLGHYAGDEVLRVTAGRIVEAVRKSDTVARMGGDEFVVLLPDLNDPEAAGLIAQKVVAGLSNPVHFAGHEVPVSVSVGVCCATPGDLDADVLLKNVDIALYRAKARGRNRFEVFTPDAPRDQSSQQTCLLPT
jgi:diguanylate cyclase (GGDEF)-like protein